MAGNNRTKFFNWVVLV